MGKSPCCDQVGVKKGPWTAEEDKKLVDYIQKHGHGSWRNLPRSAGLNRCGKSCRLRWTNYLRPDIKRGMFSDEEDALIIHLHSILGNKWSLISSKLPGRTDNEIKNYWNTHLKKKLLLMGIDPVTHQRRVDLELLCNLSSLLALPNAGRGPANPWDGTLARAQLLQGLLQLVLMPSAPPSMDIINHLLGASPAPLADVLQVNRQEEEQQSNPTGVLCSGAPMQAFHGAQSFAVQRAEDVGQRALCHSGSNFAAEYDSTPSLVAASPEQKLDEPMSSERFHAWAEMDFGELSWKDVLQEISW